MVHVVAVLPRGDEPEHRYLVIGPALLAGEEGGVHFRAGAAHATDQQPLAGVAAELVDGPRRSVMPTAR